MNSAQRLVQHSLVIFMAITNVAFAQDYSAIRKANQESIVFIHSHRDNKDGRGVAEDSFGTGFIVTEFGHVISANHVVLPESSDTVVTTWAYIGSRNSPNKFPIEVVKREPDLDLVLLALQIPASMTTRSAEIGGSSKMQLDAALYALGFPGKLDLSPSTGILSNRSGPKGRWQTTLGINRGNSGGPIFDPKTNKVVAIAWAGDDSAQQITFAIPETYASGLLQIAGSAVLVAKVSARISGHSETVGVNAVVHSNQGAVMLRGFATSASEKLKAGEIAAKVEGVKSVRNDIRVVQYRALIDSEITSMVKVRFLELANIKDGKVAVETFKGVVMLSGFAESPSEVTRAIETARKVEGVKEVSNYILLLKHL